MKNFPHFGLDPCFLMAVLNIYMLFLILLGIKKGTDGVILRISYPSAPFVGAVWLIIGLRLQSTKWMYDETESKRQFVL